MNEISTKVKKLNFLQKIRLGIFLRGYNVSDDMGRKYNKAPSYIKNDERVIDRILEGLYKGKCNIEEIQENYSPAILVRQLRGYDYFKRDTIYSKLPIGTMIELIKADKEIAREFDKDIIIKIGIEVIEQETYEIIPILQLDATQEKNILKYFIKNNFEESINIIEKCSEYFSNWSITEVIKDILKIQPNLLCKFSEKTQIEFLNGNHEKSIIKYASEKVQLLHIEQHPEFFSEISEELQRRIVTTNKANYFRMDETLQAEMVQEDVHNIRYIAQYLKESGANTVLLDGIERKDNQTIRDVIVGTKLFDARGCLCEVSFHDAENRVCYNYDKDLASVLKKLDINQISELMKIDYNYLLGYVFPFKDYKFEYTNMDALTVRCKQLFEKLYGTDKLNVFSENIEKIFIRCKEWIESENIYRTEECPLAELKVLFNNEIMENCSNDVIKRYFQKNEQGEDSQEEFRTIIRETYGEKAEKILRERNNLNVYNINSLEIFSSPILQNFSLEFVNDLISYHIKGFSNFWGIVKNPQRLKNFKLYYDLLSNIMGENVETMQRAIMQFDYIEELLNNVEEENLSEMQYKNLISVLCSLGNLSDIKTVEDLEEYDEIANKYLQQRLKNTTIEIDLSSRENIPKVVYKEIFRELLGISEEDADYFLQLFELPNDGAESSYLTESEKCMLNVMSFLRDTRFNYSKLIEFINGVTVNDGMRNPIALYSGINKIREHQIEIFNSCLLTKEEMDAKILENNSDKTTSSIYKEIDNNGLEHYYLNGLPFAFITTRLSLSSGKELKDSLRAEKIKRFLEYDGQRGASTISCSFVKRRN